jgi:hypothetical protein
MTPARTATFHCDEVTRWGELMQKSGIEPE